MAQIEWILTVTPQTNLKVIRRSRKQPQVGDVFVMQLPDERYLFGRVVDVDLAGDHSPTPSAHLIYIYDHCRPSRAIDPEELTPDRLLLPPVHTNRLGWTRGYFETIMNYPTRPADLLKRHCFWDALREGYVDERGRPLQGPVKPCGEWGLASYRLIDDHISDALGIPRAPVEPNEG